MSECQSSSDTLELNCIIVLKEGLKPSNVEQPEGGTFSEVIQKSIAAQRYLKDKDYFLCEDVFKRLNH